MTGKNVFFTLVLLLNPHAFHLVGQEVPPAPTPIEIEQVDAIDEATLIRSIRNNDFNRVREGLQAGLDANLESPSGHNALSIAAIENRPHLIEMLLDFGADIDRVSHSASALIYATSLNHSRCVEDLLSAGADPKISSTDGKTALHYAAMLGRTELVDRLYLYGAPLDIQDHQGRTPLLLAVENQHLGVVKLLLNYGADPSPKNKSGRNAKQIAATAGATEISRLLSQPAVSQEIDSPRKRKPIDDGEALVQALADASPGDILQLGAQTYDGGFVVTQRRVTIVGDPAGGTVLRNSKGAQKFILYIRKGSKVSLQNVQFEFDGPDQVGLYSAESEIELRNCRFDKATHHACFGVDSQLRLVNCRFANLARIGVFAKGKSSVTARQCVFKTGQQTAIQLESAARGELKDCRFENIASASILAIDASQLAVARCRFEKTNQGISASKLSGELSIRDSRFANYKTAILATNVRGSTRVIQCDFHQAPNALAGYFESGQSTLLARSNVFGGQFAFNVQGQFGDKVCFNSNRILGVSKGAIFVRAKLPKAESPVIRLSRNSILTESGYGVLLEAGSRAVLAQNRVFADKNMAVSIQRDSAAVLNGNCIFSQKTAVNLFETDAAKSTVVREQVYGPTPVSFDERMTTDLSQRLNCVTKQVDSVNAMQICLSDLFEMMRAGKPDSTRFEQAWAKLERQILNDRELAEDLVRTTLTIEDMAGNRRQREFRLFQSESAAFGMSRFVASDLLDQASLLRQLRQANSPFINLSKWASSNSESVADPNEETDLLKALNQQLEDPSLYDPSRFEGIVNAQFVERLKRIGPLAQQDTKTIRWVNRRLFEQAFPTLIAGSAPVGDSVNRLMFVPPGRYWVVSLDNRNLIRPTQLRRGNGAIVVSLPRSIWLIVQPKDNQTRRWELFRIRDPQQVKYELKHLRPRNWTLQSALHPDATKAQIINARQMAIASLELATLPLNDAKKIDSDLDHSKHYEVSRSVRQILALTGNATDARLIVGKLHRVDDVIHKLLWLETVAHIESRVGKLETGELIRLASATNDAETAASAAIQLHLMGVDQADDTIRNYLNNPNNRVLAQRAAWTLMDDDRDETRLAMLSFHNQLMLDMEKDRIARWKTIPTTLYLLGYGNASDLRDISVTPMTATHFKWMAPLLSDPIQAAHILIDNRNFNGARDVATSFRNRNGADVYHNRLISAIIARMQSSIPHQVQQLAMAYRGKMESDVYCSFFRPSQTAAKLLGGFDDTENKFVDLRAKAHFSPDMQSIVTWNAQPDQLDQYVRNWQAGHNNYHEKLDYFALEEIEKSLERVGGAKPPAYELFKAKHLIATARGVSHRDHFPYGIERRAYIFGQSEADEAYPGAINGVLEVKAEPCRKGTRIWIRHRQEAYFHNMGTLASTIDSRSTPKDWPIFRYLKDDGRSLIQSIRVRNAVQRFELKETGEVKDGFRAFDLEVSNPAELEHYLDLTLNFFGKEQTLCYALHCGEIGRGLRRKTGLNSTPLTPDFAKPISQLRNQ